MTDRAPAPPVVIPPLLAMVHLPALPGAPGYGGSMTTVLEEAVGRATTLTEAGFAGLMVENFGDSPFYPDRVPAVTVAAVTACVAAIQSEVGVCLGVNVLRNDALAALGVAAATGADLMRVNVLTGMMFTDQGPIVGRAAEVSRERSRIAPATRIWADVFVKHAAPPPGVSLEQAAADTWERGGADALIVSGAGTGQAVDPTDCERVRSAVPGAPLVVGSGVDSGNVATFAGVVDHIIVGTCLETDGVPGAALDARRVAEFVAAVETAGLI